MGRRWLTDFSLAAAARQLVSAPRSPGWADEVGDGEIGAGVGDRDLVGGGVQQAGSVAGGSWIGVGVDPVSGDGPVAGVAALGVEGGFGAEVLVEGFVGDFDDEEDVGGGPAADPLRQLTRRLCASAADPAVGVGQG